MKEREGGKDAERRTGTGKKLTEDEISEVRDPFVGWDGVGAIK